MVTLPVTSTTKSFTSVPICIPGKERSLPKWPAPPVFR
jgi:hypothetical protein